MVLSVLTLSCDDTSQDPFGDSLPEAPLNLRGGANDRFTQIVWDNPDQEVDGFGIERKTIGEEFRLLITVDQATTSYTSYFDSTINNHGIYYYRVYSFIQDNISSYSNVHKVVWQLNVPEDVTSIQAAIDSMVNTSGTTVLVSPGVYHENLKIIDWAVWIFSHIVIDEDTTFISKTIIDGGNNGSVVKFENSGPSVLRGFTLRNGSGTEMGLGGRSGGGISSVNSSPILEDLNIVRNNAARFGGGIACAENSSPRLKRVNFLNNTADAGGAIYCINDSHLEMEIGIISGNESFAGGGVYFEENSRIKLKNLLIVDNTSFDVGGAIYGKSTSVTFENLTIFGNFATNEAGGAYASGAGMTFRNCIIWNNLSHSEDINPFSNSGIRTEYSNVQFIGDQNTFGEGSIILDPMFMDIEQSDFHLQSGSPCIDTGDPNVEYNDFDGTRNDMGAYGGKLGNW